MTKDTQIEILKEALSHYAANLHDDGGYLAREALAAVEAPPNKKNAITMTHRNHGTSP